MNTPENFQIRPARVQDVPIILELIRDLATYERAPNEVTATEEQLVDREFMERQSGVSAVGTDWGTTSFVRLREGNVDILLKRLRSEFDTSAVPGRFFEVPDQFRIGMGVNTEMFAEGLNRIGRALDSEMI